MHARADRQRRQREHWAERTPEQVKAAIHEHYPDGTSTCSKCHEVLPLSAFRVRPTHRYGIDNRCDGCRAEAKARYLANRTEQ